MNPDIQKELAREVVESIETYLPPLLPNGMTYMPEAGDVLRRAIMRDYVEDDFSMRKHVDSPFTEAKGFQVHASYNERDFRWAEYDMLQHLQMCFSVQRLSMPQKARL